MAKMTISEIFAFYLMLSGAMANPTPLEIASYKAIVVIQAVPGKSVEGVVLFDQIECEEIFIRINISGLTEGKHGIHVHTYGDMRNACSYTLYHYNPFNKTHGGPDDEERHLGDLGNIWADKDGKAITVIKDRLLSLYDEHSIYGRSLVIHSFEDDLGKGTGALAANSKLRGNAGPPIGCGVIGIRNPAD